MAKDGAKSIKNEGRGSRPKTATQLCVRALYGVPSRRYCNVRSFYLWGISLGPRADLARDLVAVFISRREFSAKT